MTFVPIRLDDVQEGEAVPEGEYDLQILKVKEDESKAGNPMLVISARIMNEPNANLVRHWITLLSDKTPPEQVPLRKLDIKRFCVAFGIPHAEGGFDTDDFPGAQGRIFLVKETSDQGNEFNSMRLPRLPKE